MVHDQPGDLGAFGEILHRNWELKRGLSKHISNPVVDEAYSRARDAGAGGGKLLGAGGGGFLLVYAEPKHHTKVRSALSDLNELEFHFSLPGSSIIHTDGWRGYDGLVDVGYAKHLRVNHSENEFANAASHINGIESFWAYAKHRLAKFKGVAKHTFYLHLKETEFRFNHRRDNLYQVTLKLLRECPI